MIVFFTAAVRGHLKAVPSWQVPITQFLTFGNPIFTIEPPTTLSNVVMDTEAPITTSPEFLRLTPVQLVIEVDLTCFDGVDVSHESSSKDTL